MRLASATLRAMRPKQWTKNLLLFAGIIFSQHLGDPRRVVAALAGFLVFCGLSGVIYIVNDIRDADSDRKHPLKCRRPIASGDLPVPAAWSVAAVVGSVCLVAAWFLNPEFGVAATIYFVMMLAYSIRIKHVVILDLMTVALGFVVRAVAGVKAIELPGEDIPITPWFKTCVLFLALFIVICKRRHEIILLAGSASHHRPVLEHYSRTFLDQMVSVATAATVISYSLYVTLGVKADNPRHQYMVWTVLFVLYGVFRYLYLVYKREQGGAPESTFLQDPALLINVALWLITVSVILAR